VKRATFRTPDDVIAACGTRVAESDWRVVAQDEIDAFARLTHDEQWIHVDPERARRESPFGGTVAHGFLTLGMLSSLAGDCIDLPPARLAVNYGFDRVRFVAPVPAGAQIRGLFDVEDAQMMAGALAITWHAQIEIRDQTKPALSALWLARLIL
jgi:acyl dehydratase